MWKQNILIAVGVAGFAIAQPRVIVNPFPPGSNLELQPPGPAGPAGPAGATGATGTPGVQSSSGTFTPALAFGGASAGIVYTDQLGDYYTVGNIVVARVRIRLTAKGTSTGAATITGMPFIASCASACSPYGGTVAYVANIVGGGGGGAQVLVDMNATTSALILQIWNDTGGPIPLDNTAFFDSSFIMLSITYVK